MKPEDNKEELKPLKQLTEPEIIAEKNERVSDTEKDIHKDILEERVSNRKHKHELFTLSIYMCSILYASGIIFAVCSRQVGIAYFIGIMAFMTPATLIISVLIAKIMNSEKQNNKDDSSSVLMAIGKITQQIVKGFTDNK